MARYALSLRASTPIQMNCGFLKPVLLLLLTLLLLRLAVAVLLAAVALLLLLLLLLGSLALATTLAGL